MTLVIDHSGRVFTVRQVTIKDVVVNRHVADHRKKASIFVGFYFDLGAAWGIWKVK